MDLSTSDPLSKRRNTDHDRLNVPGWIITWFLTIKPKRRKHNRINL
jgi:hypothetical protein